MFFLFTGVLHLWEWRGFSLSLYKIYRNIKLIIIILGVSAACAAVEDSLLHHQKRGISIAGSERINGFLANISEIEKQMQNTIKKHPDITRVIVLGNTGSGKSSLVHALAGKPIQVKASASGPFIEVAPENQIPGFIIRKGTIAGNQVPVSWLDEDNNLVYWDCPGFMDPAGASRDIETLFAVERLFTAPCKIKIILTVDQHSQLADRGQSIIRCLKNLRGFFQNEEQLRQAISIIVTKQRAWGDTLPDPKSLFVEMGLISAVQPRRVALEIDSWVSSFLSHLDRNNRIFAFPEPRGVGEYSYDWFLDRNLVLTSLCTGEVTNPSVDIFANFTTDPYPVSKTA